MSGQMNEKKEAMDMAKYVTEVVASYLDQCIQCHRCMDVCPVTKGSFSIKELNQATKENTQVPSLIRAFAFNCMQCAKCVPVCPVNIRRDYMVRYIKHKERPRKPSSYKRYLLVKGPDLIGIRKFIQWLFVSMKKRTTRDLASFMETIPQKEAEVLFYPGCYIYSKKTVRQTLRLLDHLKCSYAVIGGVTACCGTPHLLQGEFTQADHCLELLHRKIRRVNPKIVITACAECFEAVEHIKKIYMENFEVLSVVQYLERNKEKFPLKKIRGKITIFDSCRFHAQSPQATAASSVAARFGELVAQAPTQNTSCCFQWNHGHDPFNATRRHAFLKEAEKYAPTLACTCLTCYEEFKKAYSDVDIIEVEDLFSEALDAKESGENNP
ncbi:MAG: (Fe-S)-binding protein [Candidatus Thermoplasmatota archaeon]|nr:(Fe-S)-binding protein [Candidatus Thermoplasmatota archaeon]